LEPEEVILGEGQRLRSVGVDASPDIVTFREFIFVNLIFTLLYGGL
jgi:hypothetical protein